MITTRHESSADRTPNNDDIDLVVTVDPLSPQDVVEIRRHVVHHGFAAVGPILDQGQIDIGREALARLAADQQLRDRGIVSGEPGYEAPRKVNNVTTLDAFFRDLARRPDVVDLVTSVLGPDVKLHSSIAWLKPARTGSAKDPHQDLATWRHLVNARVVTLWVTLDDATTANGCMHYVAGSHREPLLREHRDLASYSIPGFTAPRDAIRAARVPAGYGTVHDGRTIHWTPPNRTRRARRAVSFAYVSADTRLSPRHLHLVNTFPRICGEQFPGCV